MSEHDKAAVEKQRLIREGELYRIKVVHAKALVAHALQPDVMLHGAVDHAVGLAQARLGGLFGPGARAALGSLATLGTGGGFGGLSFKSIKTLMPYALSTGAFLARKRLIKPIMGLALVTGVAVAWFARRGGRR